MKPSVSLLLISISTSALLLTVSPLEAKEPQLCNEVFAEKDESAVAREAAHLGKAGQLDVAVCDDNYTPLGFAALRGYRKGVELILAARAGVDAPSKGPKIPQGTTPLMLAAANNRITVVTLLVERQANVNAVDKNGRTALGLATQSAWATGGDYASVQQYLVSHGARLTAADEKANAGQNKH